MKTRTFKQFGTFSVIILLPLLLIFSGLLIKTGFHSDPMTIIQLFLVITFLVCVLVFYQIKITIDQTTVSFKLGLGFVGKTYQLSDIKSCKAVTNGILYGIGIRMIPNGWLFNVSGLQAIELQFKNRKSIVRIGIDKPEEIASIIQSLIDSDDLKDPVPVVKQRRMNPMWIVVVILFLLPIALLISSNKEIDIQSDINGFEIKGIYGMTISYRSLLCVDTISELPAIRIKTNGYAFRNTKIGNFRLADQTNVKLFVKKGFPPYILIKSKDNKPIYINFEDKQKTIDLYNELLKNKK